MSPHGIMAASLLPRCAAVSVAGISISAAGLVDTGNFIRTTFAHRYDDLNFSVVDSGLMLDLGAYSAQNPPRSPFPPRSFMAAHNTERLSNTRRTGLCGGDDSGRRRGQ